MESKGLSLDISAKTFDRIDPTDLEARLDDEHFYVVDVRSERDYAGGHVKNSQNHSWETFEDSGVREIRAFCRTLPRSAEVVLYCMNSQQRGPSCAMALMQLLDDDGLDVPVHVLTGGMHKWFNAHVGKRSESLIAGLDISAWKDVKEGGVGWVHQSELIVDDGGLDLSDGKMDDGEGEGGGRGGGGGGSVPSGK